VVSGGNPRIVEMESKIKKSGLPANAFGNAFPEGHGLSDARLRC